MAIAENLTRFRKAWGFTQMDLAKELRRIAQLRRNEANFLSDTRTLCQAGETIGFAVLEWLLTKFKDRRR